VENGGQEPREEIRLEDDQQYHTIHISVKSIDPSRVQFVR